MDCQFLNPSFALPPPNALPPTSPPAAIYTPLTYTQLNQSAELPDWLWQGYLLPGAVTLLTSLWKSGKSTLLSVLLSRLKTGGLLAGLPIRPGRAVVLSEEPRELWWQRGQALPLDGHVHWFCKPFKGKPTTQQWLDLLEQINRMHEQKPINLLAIDSLANLAPMRNENDSVEMLKALAPLDRMTERGISVLISHHPRKGPVVAGQAARGSGALSAFADILLEMRLVSRRNPKDRRRSLRGYSRYTATPSKWVIEWTADGADYRGLGTSAEPDLAQSWPVLESIMQKAEKYLTREEIRRDWPDTAPAPAKQTLWKWLNQLVKEKRVHQEGQGTRKEPFKYWLPGMPEKWMSDFWADLMKREPEKTEGPAPPSQALPDLGEDRLAD
jgi:hypothetical protein